MKAIETTYHGPTNTRGARIVARDSDNNRISIPYPHELSGEDVHRKAAEALRGKMGWTGRLIGGGTKRGYIFVFAPGCECCGEPVGEGGVLCPACQESR